MLGCNNIPRYVSPNLNNQAIIIYLHVPNGNHHYHLFLFSDSNHSLSCNHSVAMSPIICMHVTLTEPCVSPGTLYGTYYLTNVVILSVAKFIQLSHFFLFIIIIVYYASAVKFDFVILCRICDDNLYLMCDHENKKKL